MNQPRKSDLRETPKTERMWAVFAPGKRSCRIIPYSVRRTRLGAIEAWLDVGVGGQTWAWSYWRMKGYTVERVIVSVEARP